MAKKVKGNAQIDVTLNSVFNADGIKKGIKEVQGILDSVDFKALDVDGRSKVVNSLSEVLGIFGKMQKMLDTGLSTDKARRSFSSLGKEMKRDLAAAIKMMENPKALEFRVENGEVVEAKKEIEDLEKKITGLKKNKITDMSQLLGKSGAASSEKNAYAKRIVDQMLSGASFKEAISDALARAETSLKEALAQGKTGAQLAQPQSLVNALTKLKDSRAPSGFGQAIINDLRTLQTELAVSQAKMEELIAANPSEISPTIQALIKKYEELKRQVVETTNGIVDLSTAQSEEEAQTKRATDSFKSKITQLLGVYSVYRLIQRGVSSAYNAIKDLDSAMNEIAVVTDMTTEELWGQIDAYMAVAKQYGVATRGVYEVSKLYYQQGRDTAEVVKLTAETLKMAKIASMDFVDATNFMTSTLNGFKLAASDASTVVDVYSQLAAKAAVDTQEIAYAMSKTASIAESAGMSFEDTSVFLTQMIETTREAPENIGTALKTIIARFQEMKKSPLDLIDVEGEEVSFNKVDAALKTIGISLKDANLQFRDLDDVIYQLADKWDTLDRNTQRYIATTVAGSRQQSRFLALMQDNERLSELQSQAYNSQDAGLIQYYKTLDSLESKLNQLNTTFQQFYMSIINGPAVKWIVDLITKVMEFIRRSGPAAATLMVTSMIIIIRAGLDKVGTTLIGTFAKASREIRAIMTGDANHMVSVYKTASSKIDAMKKGEDPGDLISTESAPGKSLLGTIGMGLSYVTLAISAATLLYQLYTQFVESAKSSAQRIEEYTKRLEDVRAKAATSRSEVQNLEELGRKWNSLSTDVERNTTKKEEWLNINTQIAEQYPSLIDKIGDEGAALVSLGDQYKNVLRLKKEKARADALEALQASEQRLSDSALLFPDITDDRFQRRDNAKEAKWMETARQPWGTVAARNRNYIPELNFDNSGIAKSLRGPIENIALDAIMAGRDSRGFIKDVGIKGLGLLLKENLEELITPEIAETLVSDTDFFRFFYDGDYLDEGAMTSGFEGKHRKEIGDLVDMIKQMEVQYDSVFSENHDFAQRYLQTSIASILDTTDANLSSVQQRILDNARKKTVTQGLPDRDLWTRDLIDKAVAGLEEENENFIAMLQDSNNEELIDEIDAMLDNPASLSVNQIAKLKDRAVGVGGAFEGIGQVEALFDLDDLIADRSKKLNELGVFSENVVGVYAKSLSDSIINQIVFIKANLSRLKGGESGNFVDPNFDPSKSTDFLVEGLAYIYDRIKDNQELVEEFNNIDPSTYFGADSLIEFLNGLSGQYEIVDSVLQDIIAALGIRKLTKTDALMAVEDYASAADELLGKIEKGLSAEELLSLVANKVVAASDIDFKTMTIKDPTKYMESALEEKRKNAERALAEPDTLDAEVKAYWEGYMTYIEQALQALDPAYMGKEFFQKLFDATDFTKNEITLDETMAAIIPGFIDKAKENIDGTHSLIVENAYRYIYDLYTNSPLSGSGFWSAISAAYGGIIKEQADEARDDTADLFGDLMDATDLEAGTFTIGKEIYDKLSDETKKLFKVAGFGSFVLNSVEQYAEALQAAIGSISDGSVESDAEIANLAKELQAALEEIRSNIYEAASSLIDDAAKIVDEISLTGGLRDKDSATNLASLMGKDYSARQNAQGMYTIWQGEKEVDDVSSKVAKLFTDYGVNLERGRKYVRETYTDLRDIGRLEQQLADMVVDNLEEQNRLHEEGMQIIRSIWNTIFSETSYDFMNQSPTNDKLSPMYTLMTNMKSAFDALDKAGEKDGKISNKDINAMLDYIGRGKAQFADLEKMGKNLTPPMEMSLTPADIAMLREGVQSKANQDVEKYNQTVREYNAALNAFQNTLNSTDIAIQSVNAFGEKGITSGADLINKAQQIMDPAAFSDFISTTLAYIKSGAEEGEAITQAAIASGIIEDPKLQAARDEAAKALTRQNEMLAEVSAALAILAPALDGASKSGDAAALAAQFIDKLKTAADSAAGGVNTLYTSMSIVAQKLLNIKIPSTIGETPKDTPSFTPPKKGGAGLVEHSASAAGGPIAKGGKTLLGEFGPEMVFYNGKYYMAGANGPEQRMLPRGSYVFNHKQTQDILKRGTLGLNSPLGESKADTGPVSLSKVDLTNEGKIEVIVGVETKPPKKSGGADDATKAEKGTPTDFDRWYNYLQLLADLDRSISEIQAKRENLYGQAYTQSIVNEIGLLQQKEEVTKRFRNAQETYLKAFENSKVKQYGEYLEVVNGVLQIHWEKLQGMDKEAAEPIEKVISEWEGLKDSISESNQAIEQHNAEMKKLNDEMRDTYMDAEQKVIAGIKYRQQLIIDNLQQELDTKIKYDNMYLDSLRKNIDDERRMRERADTTEERIRAEKKLALLRRDTSGKSDLAIASAEKDLQNINQTQYDQRRDDFLQAEQEAAQAAQEAIQNQLEIQTEVLSFMDQNVQLIQETVDEILASGPDNLASFLASWSTEYLQATPTGQQALNEEFADLSGKVQGYLAYLQGALTPIIGALNLGNSGNTNLNPNAGGAPAATSTPAGGGGGGGGTTKRTPYKTVLKTPDGKVSYTGESWNSKAEATAKAQAQVDAYNKQKKAGQGPYGGAAMGSYSEGGLVDYTGPAIIHGTKRKPEAVLNPQQTAIFQELVDHLDPDFGSRMSKPILNTRIVDKVPTSSTISIEKVVFETGTIANDYGVKRAVAVFKNEIEEIAKYKGDRRVGGKQ